MDRPDDELDNLLRTHLAGQLDPMRGQARRAFEREVTAPMRHRLRAEAWQRVRTRARQAAPLVLSMAACAALGFYLPRGFTPDAGPVAAQPSRLEDYNHAVAVRHEDRGPALLPDGNAGRRVVATLVESASWVDPRTNARTEVYVFPGEQEYVSPAARQ